MDLLKELRKGPSRTKGAGRVAFMAHKDAIEEALAQGYTVRQIHEALEKSAGLTLGYSQFARYVAKYISGDPAETSQAPQGKASTAAEPRKTGGTPPVFRHQAKPGDDDDLIG